MKFRWEKSPWSKAELWECRKLDDNDPPQRYGRYVGFVRHFQHESHDHWNAYRVTYASGQNPNKYLLTAKTKEEAMRAFEVAVRLE
jgi:hypothetical protein